MNCDQYQELIISQICGEIEGSDEANLNEHLEVCSVCKTNAQEFRSITGLMRQLPQREWDENLKIRDLLRRNQRWRTIVFSKAALWLIAITAFLGALTILPLKWEVSANEFSVRWGSATGQESQLAEEMQKMQQQLLDIQRQNHEIRNTSETRFQQLLKQNNLEQQKLYWQTLEMYTNYLKMEHQADVRKIQHDIAASYNRTGQEVERTNQLLEYVLRASETTQVYGNE
jgi:hypothetical protein